MDNIKTEEQAVSKLSFHFPVNSHSLHSEVRPDLIRLFCKRTTYSCENDMKYQGTPCGFPLMLKQVGHIVTIVVERYLVLFSVRILELGMSPTSGYNLQPWRWRQRVLRNFGRRVLYYTASYPGKIYSWYRLGRSLAEVRTRERYCQVAWTIATRC
jgi:hypothetical protein